MEWQQGHSVAIIGQNGSGKTYLETRLLPERTWVVVLRTKPDDNKWPGFTRVRRASQVDLSRRHWILDPYYESQYREISAMLDRAWTEGNWTIDFDELWYCENHLHLRQPIERLLTQGRSLGITTVVGMQRPSRVSRFAVSEPHHVFSFFLEGRDAKTVAEATSPRMLPAIASLKQYQFAYYNRRTRDIIISDASHIQEVLSP